MGTGSSKDKFVGTLNGAHVLPSSTKQYSPPPLAAPKTTTVVVPKGKKSGETMTIEVQGKQYRDVEIPRGENGSIKAGATFQHRYDPGDVHRVIATSLHSVAGAEIVEQRPILYCNISRAYFNVKWNDQKESSKMARQVGPLMQEAQDELLAQTIEVGCNALLGITCNVSTDSTGDQGNSKMILITMTGTPCVVVPPSGDGQLELAEAKTVVQLNAPWFRLMFMIRLRNTPSYEKVGGRDMQQPIALKLGNQHASQTLISGAG